MVVNWHYHIYKGMITKNDNNFQYFSMVYILGLVEKPSVCLISSWGIVDSNMNLIQYRGIHSNWELNLVKAGSIQTTITRYFSWNFQLSALHLLTLRSFNDKSKCGPNRSAKTDGGCLRYGSYHYMTLMYYTLSRHSTL